MRLGFKGIPIITLMLNELTSMDDLEWLKEFTLERSYEKQEKQVKSLGAKSKE